MSMETESLAGDIHEEVSIPTPGDELVQLAPNMEAGGCASSGE